MNLKAAEFFLARILAVGASVTTLLVVSGTVSDPVNAPKLVVIGVVGVSAIFVAISSDLRNRLIQSKSLLYISSAFVVAMIWSSVKSEAPFSQNFYGVFGRNNGLLTYVFLSFVLVSALALRSRQSFKLIVNSLIFSGLVNIVYNLWVISFGDFISWSNPYGNILGTFGNPNFIGAFLGIIFSVFFAYAMDKQSARWIRMSMLPLMLLCGYEIIDSSAIQGRVVALFGSGLVLFIWIKTSYKKSWLILYSIFCLFGGLFAIAGALQMGPLSQYIYKTSVSLRGQYWLAGWNTGQAHPFSGVGMDTFGDWYRNTRDAHALVLPGVDTVVNAAHNVPLDLFAFGGWPLFVLYLCIMGFAAISAVKTLIRIREFDLQFTVLFTAWAGYQLQSIISINQIGLAIWGWLLSGALIAYEVSTRRSDSIGDDASNQKKGKPNSTAQLSARVILMSAIGALVGLILALPPFTADNKWRSAQLARSLPALEESMRIGYFNPANSFKFMTNIQTLEESGLYDISREYALKAIEWNPNVFEFWKALYLIQASTDEDKLLALKNMNRLDPLNPNPAAVL